MTAAFVVRGLNPKTPVIAPVSGTTFDSSLTVSMTCDSADATIHYTTDGSTPTMESPVYKRFRVSGKCTVKAIAFYEDGTASEMAVAEYALGRCTDPVISSAGGTTFAHSDNRVTISTAREGSSGYTSDQVLRYTVDGSEPTAESPIYEGSFTTSESMVVKAKVFSDSFFDSNVVTANLTRVWENVATPVITAVDSFSGSKAKVKITCGTPNAVIRYTMNGSEPNSHSTKYTGPIVVTDGCTVKAYAVLSDYLNSEVATKTIVKVRGIGDVMGNPDHAFTTSGDAGFVEVTDATATLGVSMKSGAIGNDQTSVLSTTVVGSGTLSFKWKTSCEEDELHAWDHIEFAVDGEVIACLDGVTAWTPVEQRIAGEGTHTVTWTYVKDDAESAGEDCAWLSDYNWRSDFTETQTTEVPVPYAWLNANCVLAVDEYEAYENLAKSLAENGRDTAEACYVAGLDPESETSFFKAEITMDENNQPIITWDPELAPEEAARRVYTTYGSPTLASPAEWPALETLSSEAKSACRFFKVSVQMR